MRSPPNMRRQGQMTRLPELSASPLQNRGNAWVDNIWLEEIRDGDDVAARLVPAVSEVCDS